MVDLKLLEIICCPICHGDLEFEKEKLICKNCSKEYIIKDEILVLLEDHNY